MRPIELPQAVERDFGPSSPSFAMHDININRYPLEMNSYTANSPQRVARSNLRGPKQENSLNESQTQLLNSTLSLEPPSRREFNSQRNLVSRRIDLRGSPSRRRTPQLSQKAETFTSHFPMLDIVNNSHNQIQMRNGGSSHRIYGYNGR